MALRFVTGNEGKVREAEALLGTSLEMVAYEYTELQADRLAPIAMAGAVESFVALGGDRPVLVEDSGLFVPSLGGFPGPYSAFVEDTLGVERVWRLASSETERAARFESVVAFCDGHTVRTFTGSVEGELVAPRGSGGFGYDPILEVAGRTLAERTTEEKNEISHRGRALRAFAGWYDGYDRGSTSGPG